ncbi:MAG: repair protein SbcD/Mre11 [Candidatus Atribacteria bacterium]|nr:repair protein SbcD/Mre11 [Candidatus Atribacteria bacterium]
MKPRIKILHTADWHLGLVSWKSQGGINRLEEQKECLATMVQRAREEKVDLILHAGDLFHHSHHPAREVIELVMETLLELSEIAPLIWVLGNHDWYALRALKVIFPRNIHILKDFHPLKLEEIPVTIFPLPYLNLARLLGRYAGDEIQDVGRERLSEIMERQWPAHWEVDRWQILLAHGTLEELAFYAQANAVREVFLKRGELPRGIHYGAFGHLHAYIPVEKSGFPIYYPSSLVLDNFGHQKNQAGFIILELIEGEKPQVEFYPFATSLLVTYRVTEENKEIDTLEQALEQEAAGRRVYFRLEIPEELIRPEWYSQLRELEGESWKVVQLEIERGRKEEIIERNEVELTHDAIPDLFRDFCQRNNFPQPVVNLFEQYYRQVVGDIDDETG